MKIQMKGPGGKAWPKEQRRMPLMFKRILSVEQAHKLQANAAEESLLRLQQAKVKA